MTKVDFCRELGHAYRTILKFEGGDKPIPAETQEKLEKLLKERHLGLPSLMDFSDRPYREAYLQSQSHALYVAGSSHFLSSPNQLHSSQAHISR